MVSRLSETTLAPSTTTLRQRGLTPNKSRSSRPKFRLDAQDIDIVGDEFRDATYVVGRRLDDTFWHRLDGGPNDVTYSNIAQDLSTLAEYADSFAENPVPQEYGGRDVQVKAC